MGNRKQKWTPDEEEVLKAGVLKHGTGKWKIILKDPEFSPFLSSRSNIDLKDKWRNMGGHMSGRTTCPNTQEGIWPPKPITGSDAPTPVLANAEASAISMQNVAARQDIRLNQSQPKDMIVFNRLGEEAALIAADKIAEAENKSFLAEEAVKEAERVENLYEEAELILQLAKEIVEKCKNGEVVLVK